MITILSFGTGNVLAIRNIYHSLGIAFKEAQTSSDLDVASKVILPGVGAFDQTMELLDRSGMREALDRLVLKEQIPVLGVCVGMQVMAKSSEEGTRPGLGWIDAEVVRIDESRLTEKPRLPHMGWNSVRPTRTHAVLDDVDCETGFYFLHSYCFRCHEQSDVLTYTDYGGPFPSAVQRGNVFGFQFHPEKSHRNGVNVFRNFARL